MIAATVGLPDQAPLDPWQRFEQADIPPGKVEDHRLPAVKNWIRHKPEFISPVWSIPDDKQSDLFNSFAKDGDAPAGWLHPTAREVPLKRELAR